MYFDTMVFDPGMLSTLVKRWGADHVLLGTDYPFDMGETDPLALLGRVEGLSDEERSLIAGGNAARMLGIDGSSSRLRG
jgi:aminocarboxymuconate-semialdehyde decarboxylase